MDFLKKTIINYLITYVDRFFEGVSPYQVRLDLTSKSKLVLNN
jgi:hypothetical protein